MKFIVGLGNPGEEYAQTRHNFGFIAVSQFAAHHQLSWQNKTKFAADVAELSFGQEKIILAKPTTFYNLVGHCVQKIQTFYKINITDILIIHDDMALPLGSIRTRRGGSDAGNNGIRNITDIIGSNFARIRIGSGLAPSQTGDSQPACDRRDYVLSRLDAADNQLFHQELATTRQIITEFAAGSFIETTYR